MDLAERTSQLFAIFESSLRRRISASCCRFDDDGLITRLDEYVDSAAFGSLLSQSVTRSVVGTVAAGALCPAERRDDGVLWYL